MNKLTLFLTGLVLCANAAASNTDLPYWYHTDISFMVSPKGKPVSRNMKALIRSGCAKSYIKPKLYIGNFEDDVYHNHKIKKIKVRLAVAGTFAGYVPCSRDGQRFEQQFQCESGVNEYMCKPIGGVYLINGIRLAGLTKDPYSHLRVEVQFEESKPFYRFDQYEGLDYQTIASRYHYKIGDN